MCEALGGYLSGSLAIQGDAVHMLSDVASYLLAIVALWASAKRPNKKYTFGFSRAEPLGALGTFVFIWQEYEIFDYELRKQNSQINCPTFPQSLHFFVLFLQAQQ